MKIRISRRGYPNEKLWGQGYHVWLICKFLGFYVTGYDKGEKRARQPGRDEG